MSDSAAQSQATVKKRKTVIILMMLLILALVGCFYWFWQYKKSSDNTPEARQKQLVSQLDKVAVHPSEEPVITTVANASKLTNPTLSKEAHNGDTLFIFSKSHRIILYRTVDRKVVDMLNIQPK